MDRLFFLGAIWFKRPFIHESACGKVTKAKDCHAFDLPGSEEEPSRAGSAGAVRFAPANTKEYACRRDQLLKSTLKRMIRKKTHEVLRIQGKERCMKLYGFGEEKIRLNQRDLPEPKAQMGILKGYSPLAGAGQRPACSIFIRPHGRSSV